MTDSELEQLMAAAAVILAETEDETAKMWAESVIDFGEDIMDARNEGLRFRGERNDLMREQKGWEDRVAEVKDQLDAIKTAHAEQVAQLNATIENLRQRMDANQTANNELISDLQRRLKEALEG